MLVGVLVGLIVLALGFAGIVFIPETWLTGWVALIVTVLFGLVGLLLLFSLLRRLIRISLGAAVSPAGDPPGKLIAITFAAVMVPSIPLFLWNAGTRILQDIFGGNPAYQGLFQFVQASCRENDESCLQRMISNAFAVLLRFFSRIFDDLGLSRLPLIDLFWFAAAAVGAAIVINLVRTAISRSSAQMPLEVMRNMIPEGLRRRLPAVILLIAAFYLGLSAMFAIPVLRSGADLGLSSAAITDAHLQAPTEIIARLQQLDAVLGEIALAELPAEPSTPLPPPAEGGPPVRGPAANDTEGTRQRTSDIYIGIYERQRNYLRTLIAGAEVRFRQLAAETRSRASSSPRAFLGQRDKDRFIATVTDYYRTTVSKYEIRLYNCRNSLIELRERIAQYRTSRDDTSFFGRLLNPSGLGPSAVDKAASDAIQACPSANNPEQIEPKLPPDPFELLGPFGATVRWLVTTDSRAITTIIGMIGFGLLGATLSRIIRKSENEEGQLTGLESFFVVAGGVTAAFVVFLGSYAMLGDQTSEPNPYVVFVTCLVGAVFSEDIWTWAREKFMPKKDEDEKAAKEKKAKEQAAQEQAAREQTAEAGVVKTPSDAEASPSEESLKPNAAKPAVPESANLRGTLAAPAAADSRSMWSWKF